MSDTSDKLVDENDTWSNCDDWEDNAEVQCECPLCGKIQESVEKCFSHSKEIHEFDFHSLKKQQSNHI